MAIEVKHQKVSAVSDGGDSTLVQPSDWNSTHDITMASGNLLGRTSSGAGDVEELSASSVRTFLNVADGADVTDATSVTAAGAVMDSELTSEASVKAIDQGLATTDSPTFAGLTVGGVSTSIIRETLVANRTYYVRTDGSDSNDGLSNTSGGAFLTIGKAMAVCATIDFNSYAVTVQVGAGTYSETVTPPLVVGLSSINNFVIRGDTTTPSNVVISRTGNYTPCFEINSNVLVTLEGFQVSSTGTGGYGIRCTGKVNYASFDFSTCFAHLFALNGKIQASGNYTISGDANYHFLSELKGTIECRSRTLTFSGTRAFTIFAFSTSISVLLSDGCTFTGTVTGQRYLSDYNSIIQTYGGGANYFPGNSAGVAQNGGYYL